MNSGGTTFFTTSSMTASLSVPCATSSRVLRRDDDGRRAHGLAVAVLDRHLALAVGAEERELPVLARLAEALADAVRGVDGEGHVLLRLVAREAEHHALVAGALLLEQALALGDALGDVGRLPLDRGDDGAAVAC